MKVRHLRYILLMLIVLALVPAATTLSASSSSGAALAAQERSIVDPPGAGRVSGVLRDPSGAVIRLATVEIRHATSGVVQSTISDHAGRYVFDSLPAGRYQLTASSPGFAEATREDVVVQPGHDRIVDIVLEVARQEAVVVVTAPALANPLAVESDPRAPRQPIPAHDGADYLKAIPGFSVVRKGGSDGDPVLRGMAGSRLGVLLDGQQIFGGCGGRMDPPTAYVFPAAYDRITVLKGPQTVLYAAGSSAGTVLFERNLKRLERPAVKIASSLTAGAFGRHDEMVEVRAGIPSFYLQGTATRSHTGDYRDGNGAAVHSLYTRWSGNAAFGWTPSDTTLFELSTAISDGRAAFADRSMDASKFARENVALKFDKHFTSSPLQRIQVQSYYNYIDHVMDNFSLRIPGSTFAVMNPDRATMGGRAVVTLVLPAFMSASVGGDVQHNVHTGRSVMGATSPERATGALQAASRAEDMRFDQLGLFAEATAIVSPRARVVGGARADWHEARDSRACVGAAMCPGTSPFRNDTKGRSDRRTLPSGFARYEHDLTMHGLAGSVHVGVGHVERFADFWERSKQDPVTLKSTFLSIRPEKTTQLDAGVLLRGSRWSGSLAVFHGVIRDYVLIRWQPTPAVSRNVDATTTGGEAHVSGNLRKNLTADVTLAYVRATNDTDRRPLAQQPPLETRLGLTYDNKAYSFGGLVRVVGSQDRVDVGSGNIVSNGMDLGPTKGFSVFSLNAGYRLARRVLITAGIDNVFDRAYAEHISQGGASVPGFVPTIRVNEPGRTAWLKANFSIE